MKAREMVTKLRIAMGDEVEPYMIPTQTIFQWLSDAYLRIQIEFEQWKFFHQRGLIFRTIPGVAEYVLDNVKEIGRNSVYYVRPGELVRFPMYFLEYDAWVMEEQVNLQRQGDLRYLIKLPNDNYRVEPVPIEVCEIWGDLWYEPAGFYGLDDAPIWDDKYHDLVVWEALKVASLEWPDNKKTQRMQANLLVNLPTMRRAFNYEYLMPKGSARAFL